MRVGQGWEGAAMTGHINDSLEPKRGRGFHFQQMG